MKRILTILPALLLYFSLANSQEIIEEFSAPDIKSDRIFRPEWNLSYPVIGLNSGEKLILQFDQLEASAGTFYYTFIHCDKDWKQSDIFTTDYLEGFPENQVEDYQMSFNTTVNYIHYSVTFPNSDIRFKYSGNYVVKVYPVGEPDEPVLVKRFMVSEKSVSITPEPQRSKLTTGYNTHQQVDFTVDHAGFNIIDPNQSIFASILQNGRWDNARTNLKPDFIRSGQLAYNDISGKTNFPGGNEFRYFDIKSLRYQTEYVRSIEYFNGKYNVYLMPSQSRGTSEYFYWQDFNGKYYIAFQEGREPEIESDYVSVFFTLPSGFPEPGGDVFVYGALTGWKTGEENMMYYNAEEHRYELSLLLKQGWYNYIYAVADKKGKLLPDQEFESNHFETENDYLILVYYRNPSGRYDRLIGNRSFNTFSR